MQFFPWLDKKPVHGKPAVFHPNQRNNPLAIVINSILQGAA
jgi:hypothetical protein